MLFLCLCMALVQCTTKNNEGTWKMNHIDRQYFNHNSLSPGDVNGDGFDDYVVIHEGPDKVTVILHPGVNDRLYQAWEKIVVSEGNNVEYAYFGDLNGDENLDIVYVNGDGSYASIIWGPDRSHIKDPGQWRDTGPIPSSMNQGHYLYVETSDINLDGALDIIAGGRRHHSGRVNGLIWFEAPADKEEREDLEKWAMHPVDSMLLSGHGFEFEDINRDGYQDIIIANADWDTPDNEEMVLWYEHPGPDPDAVRNSWEKHIIFESQMFFAKPQVGVGDVNQDGKTDLAVQTDNYLFYMEQQEDADDWKIIKINKPEITRWVTRPTEIADLNGDGKLDIVGAMIHNWGYTAEGKATVFWMEYTGEEPGPENWQTHVIKWSDGYFPGNAFNGEKWDHIRFADLDRDGDLDIIGNCEEYYDEDRNTILGVVWFENRMP